MRVGPASRFGVPPAVVGTGLALAAMAVVVVAWRFGATAGLGVGVGALAALLLVSDARAAVMAYVLVVVFAEEEDWGIALFDPVYEPVVAFVGPVDLLGLLAVASVALERLSGGARVSLPRAYLLPLALYAVALASGTITGYFGDSPSFAILGEWQTFAHLLVTPFLVAHVVAGASGSGRLVLPALGVAVLKALAGLAVVFSGLAPPAAPGQPALTYYAATGNWVVLVALVAMTAAILSGARPGIRGVALLVPLAACLVLSYRRSFWIAALLCLALVSVLATGRPGRRILLPAGGLTVLAAYVALSAGLGAGLQGPLAERVRTLDPQEIRSDEQDRYRLGERRNVVADLGSSPLLGLGLGSEWTARYPVGLEFEFSRGYVHTAALWHWLKMGLAGLAAYLALLATAAAVGWRVWRGHADRGVRCGALAVAVGFVGLAVVELSGTFVGTDLRMGVVLGAALGWLAVAHAETSRMPAGRAVTASLDAVSARRSV